MEVQNGINESSKSRSWASKVAFVKIFEVPNKKNILCVLECILTTSTLLPETGHVASCCRNSLALMWELRLDASSGSCVVVLGCQSHCILAPMCDLACCYFLRPLPASLGCWHEGWAAPSVTAEKVLHFLKYWWLQVAGA